MPSTLRLILSSTVFTVLLSTGIGGLFTPAVSAQATNSGSGRDMLRAQITEDVLGKMNQAYQITTNEIETFGPRFINSHLRSTNDFYPTVSFLREHAPNRLGEIRTSIRYVKIASKPVRFEAKQLDDSTLISIRIHIQNLTTPDTPTWAGKLSNAAAIWRNGAPRVTYNRPMLFEFLLVPTAREAHFSVRLVEKSRGPYDKYWDKDWSPTTLAHEIGHMMGLKDEYDYFAKDIQTNTAGCFEGSLM